MLLNGFFMEIVILCLERKCPSNPDVLEPLHFRDTLLQSLQLALSLVLFFAKYFHTDSLSQSVVVPVAEEVLQEA